MTLLASGRAFVVGPALFTEVANNTSGITHGFRLHPRVTRFALFRTHFVRVVTFRANFAYGTVPDVRVCAFGTKFTKSTLLFRGVLSEGTVNAFGIFLVAVRSFRARITHTLPFP